MEPRVVRQGTKGPLRASFAAARVRVADGAPTRAGIRSQHLPKRGGGLAHLRAPLASPVPRPAACPEAASGAVGPAAPQAR